MGNGIPDVLRDRMRDEIYGTEKGRDVMRRLLRIGRGDGRGTEGTRIGTNNWTVFSVLKWL